MIQLILGAACLFNVSWVSSLALRSNLCRLSQHVLQNLADLGIATSWCWTQVSAGVMWFGCTVWGFGRGLQVQPLRAV